MVAPDSAGDAHAFETAMRRAAQAVSYNVLFRRALPPAAQAVFDTVIGPAASADQMKFLAIVQGLERGNAVLQPYTVGSDPTVRMGVTMAKGASLGWWAIAVQVLKVAAQAALATAGFVLVDGWNTTNKIEAEAKLTRAKTETAVTKAATEIAATDPSGATKLLSLVAQARTTAESGSQSMSWLETAGTASIGIGTGLLLAAGALWLYGRRGPSRGARAR